jgi:hypothetical protein
VQLLGSAGVYEEHIRAASVLSLQSPSPSLCHFSLDPLFGPHAWQALGIRAWRMAKLWIAVSKGRNGEREYRVAALRPYFSAS